MKKISLSGLLLVVAFALCSCDGSGGPDPKVEAAKLAKEKIASTPKTVSPRSGTEGDK